MTENSRNNQETLLTDVAEKLRSARSVAKNVPYELHDFCDYLADVTNDELTPIGMIMLLTCALDDLKNERCGFGKNIAFPDALKQEKFQIFLYMNHFPLIVDKIADDAFAKEFRDIYSMVFGEAIPPVEEKQEYGVTIVEDGVVDISNKDKAEVLAALYNSSHPHGLGFLHFTAEPMTTEQARELLHETTYFDYLKGRVMKIDLSGNLVRTWGYNRDNGEGAAEKAISQCKNI